MSAEKEIREYLSSQLEFIVNSLAGALSLCTPERYSLPLPMLSGSTIGEHTRHVIEFFQCVSNAFEAEEVDYAKRARNRTIETDKDYALQLLKEVTTQLDVPNRPMMLCLENREDRQVTVPSNLYREIAYNIEHAIHHMAIIKIGLRSLDIPVDPNFGVAPSTLQYRKVCAS